MAPKNSCSSSNPHVTDLQYVFLDELSRGNKTGRHLRIRLQTRGWNRKRLAFQRVIRKLKEARLLIARRIPRDKDEYRGSQSLYELTEAGWDAVIEARKCFE
jgi:DNA-binding PadR family transcriptional regulator